MAPAPSADRLLALDVGTQSIKAIVFTPRGAIVAAAKVPIEPYTSAHPGWCEQDPLYFYSKLCVASRRVLAADGVQSDSLACVSLTTQRSTVVNVDSGGTPLRPAFVWPDQRRTLRVTPIRGLKGLAFRLIGM